MNMHTGLKLDADGRCECELERIAILIHDGEQDEETAWRLAPWYVFPHCTGCPKRTQRYARKAKP